MPTATVTTVNYTGNGTQAGLLNAISAAMVTAGFTAIKSYNNAGNEARVWSYVADASKVYGTLILELAFTAASTLRLRGYSNFDVASGTPATAGSNPNATAVSKTISSLSSGFVFWVCNHPEVRGLILVEGTTNRAFVGYLRPANFEDWDDPRAFIERGGTASWDTQSLQCISGLIPAGTSNAVLRLANSDNVAPHPRTGRRKQGVCEISSTSPSGRRYIEAEFSPDVVSVPSLDMAILDKYQVTVGVEEYTLFDGSNSVSVPRLAIRTV